MTCKKCKKICKLCEHFLDDAENSKCGASPIEEMDCVTGEKINGYYSCKDINKDGDCNKFKKNVELANKLKLIKALRKRLHENRQENRTSFCWYQESLEDKLIRNLLDCLENDTRRESRDFIEKHVYYEDINTTEIYFFIKKDGAFVKRSKDE